MTIPHRADAAFFDEGPVMTPTKFSTEVSGEVGRMTADDFRYLGKLLDWAAGEGFCQIHGMTDPDEFAFDLWDRLGRDGADYSADALADEIARAATEGRE